MKTHDKGNGNAAQPAAAPKSPSGKPSTVAPSQPEKSVSQLITLFLYSYHICVLAFSLVHLCIYFSSNL